LWRSMMWVCDSVDCLKISGRIVSFFHHLKFISLICILYLDIYRIDPPQRASSSHSCNPQLVCLFKEYLNSIKEKKRFWQILYYFYMYYDTQICNINILFKYNKTQFIICPYSEWADVVSLVIVSFDDSQLQNG